MNKKDDLLSEEIQLFKKLIFQCNLKIQDKYAFTTLMYVLIYNESYNLNLNEEQFDYLIKNSDLKQQNNGGYTPLMYALMYNKEQNLHLSIKQFKTMYAVLDEEQKQITFQNLIQENFENNQQYLEEMNILLYDCEFQPHEKTIYWLTKNKHQDIIQMIEKRDLFFQLNKNFKEIDNFKKKDIIKI